jgi:hypothetical protein
VPTISSWPDFAQSPPGHYEVKPAKLAIRFSDSNFKQHDVIQRFCYIASWFETRDVAASSPCGPSHIPKRRTSSPA